MNFKIEYLKNHNWREQTETATNLKSLNENLSEDTLNYEAHTRILQAIQNNPELTAEACNYLDEAVSCLDRCQAVLITMDTGDSNKVWISVISKLWAVKETIGNWIMCVHIVPVII